MSFGGRIQPVPHARHFFRLTRSVRGGARMKEWRRKGTWRREKRGGRKGMEACGVSRSRRLLFVPVMPQLPWVINYIILQLPILPTFPPVPAICLFHSRTIKRVKFLSSGWFHTNHNCWMIEDVHTLCLRIKRLRRGNIFSRACQCVCLLRSGSKVLIYRLHFYRTNICEGGLGSRNFVCPSVCHTRWLWQI